MRSTLTRSELDSWRDFRFMVEETSLSVSRDLSSATGISGGQFGILSILVEAPLNSMRQQELADAMRWDRTRLSHVLTRMESRGWIKRMKGERGATLAVLAEAGKKQQQEAAPILGRIVKERFFRRLTPTQLASLQEIHRALVSDTPAQRNPSVKSKARASSKTTDPIRVPRAKSNSGNATAGPASRIQREPIRRR